MPVVPPMMTIDLFERSSGTEELFRIGAGLSSLRVVHVSRITHHALVAPKLPDVDGSLLFKQIAQPLRRILDRARRIRAKVFAHELAALHHVAHYLFTFGDGCFEQLL